MAVEGRRKDYWQWAQRMHIKKEYADDPTKLYKWMKDTVPSKYADVFLNDHKAELGTLDTGHNVQILNIQLPEPRRELPSNPRQLDVIAVDGCKVDSTVTEAPDCDLNNVLLDDSGNGCTDEQ